MGLKANTQTYSKKSKRRAAVLWPPPACATRDTPFPAADTTAHFQLPTRHPIRRRRHTADCNTRPKRRARRRRMSSNAQSTSHEEIRQAIAICRAFDRNLRNEFEHLGFGDEPIGSFVDCTAFKPAAFDVTDTIKSVCKSSGINVLDLSDACRPSMTVADYYVLKNRMWRHLLQKPDDAVFVACDNHLTFEFLQFDAESAIP
eukprot:7391190-Prymnesium_polylepis.2